MDVNQFLSSLTNLEKTRNFNVFKNYTLDIFQNILEEFSLSTHPKNTARISVIGTNGKGSIAHFISQIGFLSGNFQRIGLYTSPHLIKYNERIQLNGVSIPDEWINNTLNSLSETDLAKLKSLSYFEFFTFLAILYFKDNACNLEVYEAGLGGRLDATKLTSPDIIILTKIALDHVEILGETEEKILFEKLNIATENTKTLYTFKQSENVLEQTNSFCKDKGIEFIIYPHSLEKDYLTFNKEFALFLMNHIFQKENFGILEKEFLSNIPDLSGRMQIIRYSPILLFDTGHNPSAVSYLLKSIQSKYPQINNWNIYLGCLKDKNVIEILYLLTKFPNIIKIYQISGDNWNSETIIHQNIIPLLENEFSNSLKENNLPCLVMGSFRLYETVCENA